MGVVQAGKVIFIRVRGRIIPIRKTGTKLIQQRAKEAVKKIRNVKQSRRNLSGTGTARLDFRLKQESKKAGFKLKRINDLLLRFRRARGKPDV